jgi:hypothetical protein
MIIGFSLYWRESRRKLSYCFAVTWPLKWRSGLGETQSFNWQRVFLKVIEVALEKSLNPLIESEMNEKFPLKKFIQCAKCGKRWKAISSRRRLLPITNALRKDAGAIEIQR